MDTNNPNMNPFAQNVNVSQTVAPQVMQNTDTTGIYSFTLDQDIALNELEKFPKLQKNQTVPVFFAVNKQSVTGVKQPMFFATAFYYDEATKTSFQKPANPQLDEQCAAKFNGVKMRYATILGKYLTDSRGNLLPITDEHSVELFAFIFSTDKMRSFRSLLQSNWNLSEVDLRFTCDDVTYQKFTVTPVQGQCAILGNPNVANAVYAKAQSLYPTLTKYFPKQLSDAEIMALLNPNQGVQQVNPFVGQPAPQMGYVNPMAQQVAQTPAPPVQQIAAPQNVQAVSQQGANPFQTPPTVQNPQITTEFDGFVK